MTIFIQKSYENIIITYITKVNTVIHTHLQIDFIIRAKCAVDFVESDVVVRQCMQKLRDDRHPILVRIFMMIITHFHTKAPINLMSLSQRLLVTLRFLLTRLPLSFPFVNFLNPFTSLSTYSYKHKTNNTL